MTSPLPPKERFYLFALLAFFIAKSVLFSFLIPLGQAPDEESHIDYIHWLIEKHSPPRIGDPLSSVTFQLYGMGFPPLRFQTANDGRTRVRYYEAAERDWAVREYVFDSVGIQTEGAQPPLYYGVAAVLTAPFHGWVGPLGYWRIARFVSVLFGCIAIVAAWYVGRELAAGDDLLLKFFPAIMVALDPMTGFVMSVVTNDAALIALSYILLAQVVLHRGGKWCALTAALLLLTKASAVAAVAWWLIWWLIERRSKRDIIAGFLIAVAPIGLWLLLTWLVRGETAYFTFISKAIPPVESSAVIKPSASLLHGLTTNLWLQFGGVIGWLGKPMPDSWHWARGCITLLVAGAAASTTGRKRTEDGGAGKQLIIQCISFVVLWWAMLAAGGWATQKWSGSHTIQGRMMLPCLLPILCIMQMALRAPTRVRRPLVLAIIGISLIGSAYMTLFLPYEFYYEVSFIEGWRRALAATQSPTLNHPAIWRAIYALAIAAFCGTFSFVFVKFLKSVLAAMRQRS